MKKQRMKALATATMLSAGALLGSSVSADPTLNAIFKTSQSKLAAGAQSQQRIDKLADDTASLLQDFKVVNKEIAGLKVYNAQLQKQLDAQLQQLAELDESIANVKVLDRQIQPLMMRMLDALDQFVGLDVPFKLAERRNELQKVRNNMDSANYSVSEKFRQVLELYKVEAEYGRKVDAYEDTLPVEGQEREVNVLQVGRIALLFQTKDTKISGAWNSRIGDWEVVDSGEYRSAILKGIRISKGQASKDIMTLPILAPEAPQ